MSRKSKIIISAVPVVALCVLIFCLSHQPGSKSDNTSSAVVSFLPTAICERLAELLNTDITTAAEIAENYIRKAAHFCEFGLLSFLSSFHFSLYCRKHTYLSAFLFSSVYAVSDEIHQLFVVGRSCELRDIFIDSMGAFFGVLIFAIGVLIVKKIRFQKKNKKNT